MFGEGGGAFCHISSLLIRTNYDTAGHCSETHYDSSKVYRYYFHDCRSIPLSNGIFQNAAPKNIHVPPPMLHYCLQHCNILCKCYIHRGLLFPASQPQIFLLTSKQKPWCVPLSNTRKADN